MTPPFPEPCRVMREGASNGQSRERALQDSQPDLLAQVRLFPPFMSPAGDGPVQAFRETLLGGLPGKTAFRRKTGLSFSGFLGKIS